MESVPLQRAGLEALNELRGGDVPALVVRNGFLDYDDHISDARSTVSCPGDLVVYGKRDSESEDNGGPSKRRRLSLALVAGLTYATSVECEHMLAHTIGSFGEYIQFAKAYEGSVSLSRPTKVGGVDFPRACLTFPDLLTPYGRVAALAMILWQYVRASDDEADGILCEYQHLCKRKLTHQEYQEDREETSDNESALATLPVAAAKTEALAAMAPSFAAVRAVMAALEDVQEDWAKTCMVKRWTSTGFLTCTCGRAGEISRTPPQPNAHRHDRLDDESSSSSAIILSCSKSGVDRSIVKDGL
jgi:hypothetical protein